LVQREKIEKKKNTIIATSATSQIWKKEHCDSGPQMQVLSRGLQIWVNNISVTLKTPICALLLLVGPHSFRNVCGIKSGLFRFSSVKSGVFRSGMLPVHWRQNKLQAANFFRRKGTFKIQTLKDELILGGFISQKGRKKRVKIVRFLFSVCSHKYRRLI
jgi:hypothetical protein